MFTQHTLHPASILFSTAAFCLQIRGPLKDLVIASSCPAQICTSSSLLCSSHPPQCYSLCSSPLPACSIPGSCLTGGKLGLTGGQLVSQADRREHCLSPVISSSLLPYLNPAA